MADATSRSINCKPSSTEWAGCNRLRSSGFLAREDRGAGRKGIYLNAVDWQIPDNAKEVYKTLGAIASPATYGSTKSTSRNFPKTDYTWEGDEYFKYWDAHKEEYGVPYFPNVTKGWDRLRVCPPPSPTTARNIPTRRFYGTTRRSSSRQRWNKPASGL